MRSPLSVLAVRLVPGADLKASLLEFAGQHSLKAGCILTAVGSLQAARLRCAGQSEGTAWRQRFEIVSLVGTFSASAAHLHMALADEQGQMLGGHVMPGCVIYTTAEIVVGELETLAFNRAFDLQTGYPELQIDRR
ncbi:MAG: DNA-binding protein [Leptolyngbyaceae cyanobacterium SM1_1_3]|nr:DNA-binding protein [Leptolyngbyaceae cyanobacterium SM1_1_3]NJO11565.1 DNA-binding protein [Leptolyngbyaceae cyanobacterium SL_1_1]